MDESCTVITKAVSDVCETTEIYVDRFHTGGSSLGENRQRTERLRREVIETTNYHGIDDLVECGSLPIFVKVDVEGHEETVLRELLKCSFVHQIREIFYEVDEGWVNHSRIANILESNGFLLKKIGRKRHYDVLAGRP